MFMHANPHMVGMCSILGMGSWLSWFVPVEADKYQLYWTKQKILKHLTPYVHVSLTTIRVLTVAMVTSSSPPTSVTSTGSTESTWSSSPTTPSPPAPWRTSTTLTHLLLNYYNVIVVVGGQYACVVCSASLTGSANKIFLPTWHSIKIKNGAKAIASHIVWRSYELAPQKTSLFDPCTLTLSYPLLFVSYLVFCKLSSRL